MSIIGEQNEAFLQSLEHDLMKEIAKIDEACMQGKILHVNIPEIEKKPTLEELRQLRTHYFTPESLS